MRPVALLAGLLLLLPGCGGAPSGTAPPAATPGAESDAVKALVALADKALAEGDLTAAEDRFQRASRGAPGAASPRVGLARVALARGASEQAREHAEAALERSPEDPDALTLLARVHRRGAPAEARALLDRALARDPDHVAAHARLAELTGPAPRQPIGDLPTALALARRHPYDPWARVRAARWLASEGRVEEASAHAVEALWLTSGDPESGRAAGRLLASIDPVWARRRTVAVHVLGDDDVRADADWPVRMRLLLRRTSGSLYETLDTAFVPSSFRAFSSAGTSAALHHIREPFLRAGESAPPHGIVAGFTEREPPRRQGSVSLGEAIFLGRHLLVRLEPGETTSRTLIHEILHLYGGVHIAEPAESILNPRGDSLVLDPANHRIVSLLGERRFGPGGPERNVFPFTDLPALTAAYATALRIDLAFRRLGVLEARAATRESRYVAARQARAATALDPHLADVARLLARLLLQQDRAAEAARVLEMEARLRGPRTRRGQAAAREAAALRATLPADGP